MELGGSYGYIVRMLIQRSSQYRIWLKAGRGLYDDPTTAPTVGMKWMLKWLLMYEVYNWWIYEQGKSGLDYCKHG